ncbi:MAG: hypothetical protein AAGI46_01800 [Planctomycetota bacterium]
MTRNAPQPDSLSPPGRLRVFVAGSSAARAASVAVGQALNGDSGFAVAVIDILEQPAVADEARVLATPLLELTLVQPGGAVLGVRRFVGGLTDPVKLRSAVQHAAAMAGADTHGDAGTPAAGGSSAPNSSRLHSP